MKKNVLITFDYELFLGHNSGSVKNCLIDPTNIFLESIKNYDIKIIFFVDCTYLLKLKELSELNEKINDDFQIIISQIKNLISRGHYVYPHIHTHWVDAQYDEELNQWNLSNIEKYRFDSVSKKKREKIFRESCDLLLEIIQENNKSYKMEGFRAGGWCIQPFENFVSLFMEYGIIADFSVLAGSKKNTNAIKFDFSSIKTNSLPYRFSDNEVIPVESGKFIEFPITSININTNSFFNWLLNAVLWRTNHGKNFGDGSGVPFINYEDDIVYDKNMEMISIELLNRYKLKSYKNFLHNNNYMHFISHPKMVSSHNISNFKKLIHFYLNKYDINFDWKKIQI